MTPKYPDVQVRLVGKDGNAFHILDLCQRVARKVGLSEEEVAAFAKEATSGDYDYLLQTCIQWFDIT